MAGEGLCIDPAAENSSNVPLDVADNVSFFLLDHAYPPPDSLPIRQSSADTEGALPVQTSHGNRSIGARLRVVEGGTAGGPFTNLVPNPSFEVATTGWSPGLGTFRTNTGSTISRITSDDVAGAAACQVVTTAATGFQGLDSSNVAVVSGTTYRVSVYVKGNAGGEPLNLIIGDAVVGSANTNFTATTSWQRISLTYTPGASGTTGVAVRTQAASVRTFFVDAVMVVAASSAVDYFDGDTPGAAWTSTRHGSSSTLAATGGPRLQKIVFALQQKVDKLRRECGTLTRTLPSGTTITFDVINATLEILNDRRMVANQRTEAMLTFECKPYGRGTDVTLSAHTETSLPCLVFTETGIKGDVPALGKLVVTEAQAVDQQFVMWGIQSRYYDAASSASLYYEAEGRTPLGAATAVAGPAGASGAGSNVVRNQSILDTATPVLSTQATGGGSHLSHVGTFRVFARVQQLSTNTGTISLAWRWGVGDMNSYNLNDWVALRDITAWPTPGWELADLGTVSIPKVAQGTQRWEGQLLAKSGGIGDTLYVDNLMLVPVDEGFGEASSIQALSEPSGSWIAYDPMLTAGALTGRGVWSGTGNWAAAGDATDFTGSGTVLTRTATTDTTGRYGIAGTATAAANAVRVDIMSSLAVTPAAKSIRLGLIARYVDANNMVRCWVNIGDGSSSVNSIRFEKIVAGTTTTLTYRLLSSALPGFAANAWYTLAAAIDADGRISVYLNEQGATNPTRIADWQDSALATGGTLATGKVGIYDASNTASTRSYDNFGAWQIPTLAALFASRQAEIRHDQAIRQDSSGSFWQPVETYEGDYLRVPSAGKESRTIRVFVKATRNHPNYGPDAGIDDITATLTYTPRYLILPEG